MAADPKDTLFTASDRVKQLNEIDRVSVPTCFRAKRREQNLKRRHRLLLSYFNRPVLLSRL